MFVEQFNDTRGTFFADHLMNTLITSRKTRNQCTCRPTNNELCSTAKI